jgi:hypothetical protein
MTPPHAHRLARVFVDSSANYALPDRDEPATHPMALAIRDRPIAERAHLFTTNLVLATAPSPSTAWAGWRHSPPSPPTTAHGRPSASAGAARSG